MNFHLAKGIFPYVITPSKDSWGHHRGIWVQMPEGLSDMDYQRLKAHEEHHVAQWYSVFPVAIAIGLVVSILHPLLFALPVIGATLGYRRKDIRLSREVAAYGESLRMQERNGAKRAGLKASSRYYASLLVNNDKYKLADDEERIADLIWEAYEEDWLFG